MSMGPHRAAASAIDTHTGASLAPLYPVAATTPAPRRLPAIHVAAHTMKAWATVIRAWSGSTRVGETWAPGIGSQITGGERSGGLLVAASAGESRCGREHQHSSAAAVFEAPSVGHREPGRVTFAKVVVVRVATCGEIVEPYDGPAVLVGQRRRCHLRAAASRALPIHARQTMRSSDPIGGWTCGSNCPDQP